jgi:hypothetical protein
MANQLGAFSIRLTVNRPGIPVRVNQKRRLWLDALLSSVACSVTWEQNTPQSCEKLFLSL